MVQSATKPLYIYDYDKGKTMLTFQIEDLKHFPQKLKAKLDDNLARIDAIVNDPDANDFASVTGKTDEMDEELDTFFTPLSHLNSVMNSEETRKAYEACLPMLSAYGSKIAQNNALYEKIKAINTDDAQERKALENDIRDFELAGVNLPQAQKKRLEEINTRLSELSNTFSQNLLDATNAFELIVDEKDVEGMPASDTQAARIEEEGRTRYRFTLQMPSYLAYMTYGPNRKHRETLYKAYNTRAPQNAEIIDEILRLRKEKAEILGFENYATYALQTRDASSEEAVLNFLHELADAALPQAKRELDTLRAFARELDGIELQSWDTAYYGEKLKKKLYDYDDTMSKPYFEQTRTLEGMLALAGELFDVRFERCDSVPVWHESVKVYDIYENGALSGRLYFDLEAREEKRGGAWMHDWETHFVDTEGRTHLPSAFVVANFSPASASMPSLLRHDDVVTLFHEMGHALHHVMSKVKVRSVSGINGVAWDVVEFPSQFFENFAFEAAVLKRFAFHYETGEPIPDELLSKIKATKNFQAALGILRQTEFSLFDFMLHQKLYQGEEVQALLDKIRQKTALLKPPSYVRFQHGFAHIFAGGYAAGYYSYKWAEVLSADAFFACLDEKEGFNKDMAQGYKRYILQRGGSEEMSELYRQWLGRTPQTSSLLRLYDIKDAS
jgi:oligopeptidase A